MANIFSLYGSVFIDNEKANKAIDDTTKRGKEGSTSLGQTLGNIGGSVLKVGGLVAAGATAAVGALTFMANKTGEYSGTILDASRKTSLSTTTLQELKYAGEQSGVSFEDLTGSATKFNKVFSDAATGNTAGIKTFKDLGIAIKDSSGNARSSSDVYNDVILKLAKMGDTAEANALGNDIFGKSFANLKPLLAEGAGGIEAFKQQANDLGIVMSEGAIKSGDDFSDSILTLQQSLGGLLNQVLGSLMPILQPIISGLIANMPTIQAGISQFIPIFTGFFSQLLPPLIDLAKMIFPVILDIMKAALPIIGTLVANLLPFLADLIGFLYDNFMKLMDVLNFLSPVIAGVLGAFATYEIITKAAAVAQGVMTAATGIWTTICAIATGVTTAFGAAIAFVTSPIGIIVLAIGAVIAIVVLLIKNWDTVKKVTLDVFGAIGDFIDKTVKNIGKVVGSITQIFINVFSGLWDIIKAPLNWIIDGVNVFIKALNKIKIPDWVPLVGGKGLDITLIKDLE